MEKMNMKDWKSRVLKNRHRLAIPIMTHPGIEICGYTVKDTVTDGRRHAEAILALDKRFPADACTVIMDLTVEAEAFGAKVIFPENEIPCIEEPVVHDIHEVEMLQVPSLDAGRISEYILANSTVAAQLKDKPLFAGCIGPFSLAGRLMGMTELMMAIYTDRNMVTMLLGKCAEFITEYCKALKNAGANGVIMAEPAAGLISNEDCSTYSSAYIKQTVDAVQDSSFMVILHNCGDTGHCTVAMLESGAEGYHFGNQADMVSILDTCPGDVIVAGNLDPVGVFRQACPQEVYNKTTDLLNATAKYPNFILSSGCDVPPGVPETNISAFYKALSDFNQTVK